MYSIQLKRTYEDYAEKDGYRILVDRMWPRGMKKEELNYDQWVKELAPSSNLRKDFHDDEESFREFRSDYKKELRDNGAADEFVELVKEKLKEGNVTFLYSSKDKEHNNAEVLKEWVDYRVKKAD